MRTSHNIITTPERWDRLPDRLRHDPGADVRAWIEDTPDPVERSNQVRDLGVDQIRSVCANGSPADLSALLGEVDPDAAARYVHEHDDREDIRVLVGAVRNSGDGDDTITHGVARLVSQPEELLGGETLVPGLTEVVARTLVTDLPTT